MVGVAGSAFIKCSVFFYAVRNVMWNATFDRLSRHLMYIFRLIVLQPIYFPDVFMLVSGAVSTRQPEKTSFGKIRRNTNNTRHLNVSKFAFHMTLRTA
jgi:hypothetical protein